MDVAHKFEAPDAEALELPYDIDSPALELVPQLPEVFSTQVKDVSLRSLEKHLATLTRTRARRAPGEQTFQARSTDKHHSPKVIAITGTAVAIGAALTLTALYTHKHHKK